jgi:hypothetical protein
MCPWKYPLCNVTNWLEYHTALFSVNKNIFFPTFKQLTVFIVSAISEVEYDIGLPNWDRSYGGR